MPDKRWETVNDSDRLAAGNLVTEFYGVADHASNVPTINQPTSYIDEAGTKQEVPIQTGSTIVEGKLFVDHSNKDSPEFSTVSTGTEASERRFSGTVFDDTFITGENRPSEVKRYGGAPPRIVDSMKINGGGDGVDTVILPGKRSDYVAVPPELADMPGNETDNSDTIVLLPINPGENDLQRIVVTDVENFIFTGDSDALQDLRTVADERDEVLRTELGMYTREQLGALREEHGSSSEEYKAARQVNKDQRDVYQAYKGITPDAVEQYLENTKTEQVSFDDIKKDAYEPLDPDQVAAYNVAGQESTRDLVGERFALLKRINRMANRQPRNDSEEEIARVEQGRQTAAQELEIASGKVPGENTIRIPQKDGGVREIVVDPPLTPQELALLDDNVINTADYDVVVDTVMESQVPDWQELKIDPQEITNVDAIPEPGSPAPGVAPKI